MLLSLLSKRSLDVDSRDAYGFTLRPQHLQRYREYASIYKEEEAERLGKWNSFLEQQAESAQPKSSSEEEKTTGPYPDVIREGNESSGRKSISDVQTQGDPKKEVLVATQKKHRQVQMWAQTRPSIGVIESMTSSCIKNKHMKDDGMSTSGMKGDIVSPELLLFPLKKELELLVRGGVPRDLRGEVWQAFVGVRTRRVERYYQGLLDPESEADNSTNRLTGDAVVVHEKWRKQIEKDLPRTFPGHPALDEGGRNSLRRVLIAYARHNPSVGYCQAMNFFAGILLLMMPEENAFWTFVGIIDDYFDGYYSQEMIESQVDQLVFEDLMREKFPKLVNHLDYLGVQVAWISGPWFLSIFVNMIPWESVLRVWDVLLFEGNRVMLFRTALALMELYGPALVTTDDAGDAITLLQSLVGSTFDSGQLILTACMGFLTITQDRLQELREKHRPAVLESVEERSKGGRVRKDSKGLATKLYSFKHNPESLVKEKSVEESDDKQSLDRQSTNMDKFAPGLSIDAELEALPDIQDQVVWLKVELSRLLEEKRSATLRAEELETALMEIVKEDNRRQLSARVEQLEQEVTELRQTLADKKEQENAMLQVLMRVEREQKVAEDACIFAEQDAAAQRYALHVIEEKYEKAMASLAKMEKRVIMAESMLEATLQYESGQIKAQSSPRSLRSDSSQVMQTKRTSLLSFGLNWRDRNKAAPTESKSAGEVADTKTKQGENNGNQGLER